MFIAYLVKVNYKSSDFISTFHGIVHFQVIIVPESINIVYKNENKNN